MPVGGGAVAGRSLRVRKQLDEVHVELQGGRVGRRRGPADHPVESDDARISDAAARRQGVTRRVRSTGPSPAIEPIAAACAATADAGAFTFHCAATWTATTSNAYFCGRPPTTVLTETCGTEHELIDTSNAGTAEYIYVFDSAGKLSAISYSTGGTSHCIAGPEAFVDPLLRRAGAVHLRRRGGALNGGAAGASAPARQSRRPPPPRGSSRTERTRPAPYCARRGRPASAR